MPEALLGLLAVTVDPDGEFGKQPNFWKIS
jgi:hypothetical protein